MMSLLEKATIMHYHRHRTGAYAQGTVETLGYRGTDSQTKRFEALAGVGDINGCSVLDVGCGYGDLKGFLDERFHDFSYVGIDQMAEFVAHARGFYGQRPTCYFCVADFSEAELPTADYVFACGVLGYRCADEGFHLAMIEKCYSAANRAFAFTMLDDARFPEHPLLVGHDAGAVMAFCRALAPEARLVRGYPENDFTVQMSREARR